jgi:putative ABC transport system permease protein
MNAREHVSSILVAALGSFFGVGLIQATGLIDDVLGGSGGEGVQTALLAVASVFIGLAMYTGAVVTSNTFGTIIAGRARTIALYRLIGASASELRRSVAREGLLVGATGSAIGAVLAVLTASGVVRWQVGEGNLPDIAYRLVDPLVLLPMAAVVLTTWLASRVGSRRVLDVSPIQATTGAQEAGVEEARRRVGRNVLALILVLLGVGLLGLGVVVGSVSPMGLVVAFLGGVLSFTGIVLGAHLVMPFVLRAVGRMLGGSAAARLAAANAVRYPERSTRNTIGLVIGVTLVTTFSVAAASFQSMVAHAAGLSPEELAQADQVLGITFGVLSALIGFSSVIAAVGLVNDLSLTVLQRTRELGLLRALGFTRGQVRWMIVAESAQMVLAAVGLGLVLGIVYGWAAAQSLLSALVESGIVWPTLPWPVIAGIVGGGVLLALVASVVPSRRATGITPVRALQVT